MKKLLALILLLLCICQNAHAFKLHNPFSKKSKQEAEKMVQTKEEWEEKAKNINLEDRKIPSYQRPQDKDFKPKTPPSKKFVKYNISAGNREVNFSEIQNKLDIRGQGVFDRRMKYMAYGEYYYSPTCNQISSDIYVQKLKGSLNSMNRALSASVLNTQRTPAISTGTEEFRENLFSTLTIVDFSSDSTKLLVKEKVGSAKEGIFRNYIWIYFMDGGQDQWFAIKFAQVNEIIKKYHAKTGLALDNYRWDIKPLGFSKENPQVVAIEAFAWDKDKKQIFLGLWGLDCSNASVNLISATPMPIEISANGIIVKEFLP